ncbi:MAG: caspase family protein [Pseudomonadota bacterium]
MVVIRRLAPMIFALCLLIVPAKSQERFALLIGNQSYGEQVGRLGNPINDVNLIAKSLKAVGFPDKNIVIITDADRLSMLSALDAYIDRISSAGKDVISFFYYSGHGIANRRDRRNYLIPVGVKKLDRNVWFKAIALDDVVKKLSQLAPNAAHFVIFDACRNLLIAPVRGGKGFVPMAARRGMLIAFSTDPGDTASDEGETSGPYAAALAGELVKQGQHHLDLFQNVKEKVYRSTRLQVPWTRDGMLQRVYLSGQGLPVQTGKSNSESAMAAELRRAKEQLRRAEIERAAALRDAANARGEVADPRVLAETLQRELKRVGCYLSRVDGDWGAGSKRAMADYNLHSKSAFATTRPTPQAIAKLRTVFVRICPAETTTKNVGSRPSKPSSTSKVRELGPRARSVLKTKRTVVCRKEGLVECRERLCGGQRCPDRCQPNSGNRLRICE